MLAGQRVLLAKSGGLIAMELHHALTDARAEVIVAGTLARAINLAHSDRITAAIIGSALGGESTTELCHLLKARGMPFLIFSAQPDDDLPCEAPHVPVPAPSDAVVQKLEWVVQNRKRAK